MITRWLMRNPYTVSVVCLAVGTAICIDKAIRPPISWADWAMLAAGIFDVAVGVYCVLAMWKLERQTRKVMRFINGEKEM